MVSYHKLYLTRLSEIVVNPTTKRGNWNSTLTSVIGLHPLKIGDGAPTALSGAETSATNPFRVLVVTAISPPLAAQTIQGSFNVVIGALESASDALFYWHLHMWVMQGDDPTKISGTLLGDYEEDLGNQFPTTAAGLALQADVTLNPVKCGTGDRIVIEIGYVARNTLTSSRTGTIRSGSVSAAPPSGTQLSDLTVGSTSVSTLAGYINFGTAVEFDDPPTNTTCGSAFAIPGVGNWASETINTEILPNDIVVHPTCAAAAEGYGSAIYFSWVAPFTGTVRAETYPLPATTGGHSTVLAAYTGACGSLSQVACAKGYSGEGALATFAVTSGTTYTFRVAGRFVNGGKYVTLALRQVAAPANDNWANATNVTPLPFTDSVDTTLATVEGSEPHSANPLFPSANHQTVWYKYTPSVDGHLRINANNGTAYAPVVAVWTGAALASLTEVVGIPWSYLPPDGRLGNPDVVVRVTGGTTYYIQVGAPAQSSVGNDGGSLLKISFSKPTDLPNETCAGAIALTDNTNFAYNNADATDLQKGLPVPTGADPDDDGKPLWFHWFATDSGVRQLTLVGDYSGAVSNASISIGRYSGACGSLTELQDALDIYQNGHGITFTPTPGVDYHFQIVATGRQSGVWTLYFGGGTLPPPPTKIGQYGFSIGVKTIPSRTNSPSFFLEISGDFAVGWTWNEGSDDIGGIFPWSRWTDASISGGDLPGLVVSPVATFQDTPGSTASSGPTLTVEMAGQYSSFNSDGSQNADGWFSVRVNGAIVYSQSGILTKGMGIVYPGAVSGSGWRSVAIGPNGLLQSWYVSDQPTFDPTTFITKGDTSGGIAGVIDFTTNSGAWNGLGSNYANIVGTGFWAIQYGNNLNGDVLIYTGSPPFPTPFVGGGDVEASGSQIFFRGLAKLVQDFPVAPARTATAAKKSSAIQTATSPTPNTCPPQSQTNNGGSGEPGCNTGGVPPPGGTPIVYPGPFGTVPQYDDVINGEALTNKGELDVWIELIHTDDPSEVETQYNKAQIDLADDSSYRGGRKAIGLTAIGDLSHSLSNERGGFEASTTDVTFSDAVEGPLFKFWRKLLATQAFEGDDLRVCMASTEARKAHLAPRILSRMIVQSSKQAPPLLNTLTATDFLFSDLGPMGPNRLDPYYLIPKCDAVQNSPADTLKLPIPRQYGLKTDQFDVDPVTGVSRSKGLISCIFWGQEDLSSVAPDATAGLPTSESGSLATVASMGNLGWSGGTGWTSDGTVNGDPYHFVARVVSHVMSPLNGGRSPTPSPSGTVYGFRTVWNDASPADYYIVWQVPAAVGASWDPFTNPAPAGSNIRYKIVAATPTNPFTDWQFIAFWNDPNDGNAWPVTGTGAGTGNFWDVYVVFGHAIMDGSKGFPGILALYGSDLGKGDPNAKHDRVELNIAAHQGVDFLVPGYGGWPFATGYRVYTDANGIQYWFTVIYARGAISDDAKNGVVNLTVNAWGIEDKGDGTGYPFVHMPRAEQHWIENYLSNNWTSGLWVTASNGPKFIDGTPKVKSSSLRDFELFAIAGLGTTLGLTCGWYAGGFLGQKSVSDRVVMFNASGDNWLGFNAHGQALIAWIDPNVDYTKFKRAVDVTQRFGTFERSTNTIWENQILAACDYDPDGKKFRTAIPPVQSSRGFAKYKNRWIKGDPVNNGNGSLDSDILIDARQLTWVCGRRLRRLQFGQNTVEIVGRPDYLDVDVGDGQLVTDIEGPSADPDGWVDHPVLPMRQGFQFDSRLVPHTVLDLGDPTTGDIEDTLLTPIGRRAIATNTPNVMIATNDLTLAPVARN